MVTVAIQGVEKSEISTSRTDNLVKILGQKCHPFIVVQLLIMFCVYPLRRFLIADTDFATTPNGCKVKTSLRLVEYNGTENHPPYHKRPLTMLVSQQDNLFHGIQCINQRRFCLTISRK